MLGTWPQGIAPRARRSEISIAIIFFVYFYIHFLHCYPLFFMVAELIYEKGGVH